MSALFFLENWRLSRKPTPRRCNDCADRNRRGRVPDLSEQLGALGEAVDQVVPSLDLAPNSPAEKGKVEPSIPSKGQTECFAAPEVCASEYKMKLCASP
jgi:hypothetical protein